MSYYALRVVLVDFYETDNLKKMKMMVTLPGQVKYDNSYIFVNFKADRKK